MRIGEGSRGNFVPRGDSIRPSAGKAGEAQPAPAPTAPPAADSKSKSAEIAPLVASLGEIPEVRADVVDEIRQKIANGELLDRGAAEATAQSIFDALTSGES